MFVDQTLNRKRFATSLFAQLWYEAVILECRSVFSARCRLLLVLKLKKGQP
jgi:hypothetical protein